MSILTPNMNLPESTIGTDSGTTWESNLNAALTLVDLHDHSPGKGVPIGSSSIFLSSDLILNNNNLTLVKSVRFEDQPSALSEPLDVGVLYETGVDLWYNDGNGNKVQVTKGGAVNATSSGITSGNASAFFISNVLVVNADVATPANIQGASWLLGNNTLHSNFLTLMPPAAMGADFTLTLPSLPSSQKILTLDNAGNMVAAYVVDNTTLTAAGNVIKVINASITDAQIAPSTISIDKRVSMGFSASPAPADTVLSMAANLPIQHTGPAGILVCSGSVTTSGRPLQVMLAPTGAGNSGYTSVAGGGPAGATFNIIVDGSHTFQVQVSGRSGPTVSAVNADPLNLKGLADVAAGSHSISLFMVANLFPTHQAGIQNMQLLAYEI